jgi:chromosome segregation ATPase
MSIKQTEIERLESELARASSLRTELSEQLEVQAARVANLQRHIEDLQGRAGPVGEPLTAELTRR